MPVRKQHVVSRTVLRQWCVDGVLATHDLRAPGRPPLMKAPSAVGYVEWFVPLEFSTPIERLWSDVENEVPSAIAAADNGSLFSDSAAVATLKRLICLHLVRGLHSLVVWSRVIKEQRDGGGYETLMEWYNSDQFVACVFKARTGLEPAGPEALAAERERFLRTLNQSIQNGRMENLVRNYDRVHDEWVEPAALQIGQVTDGELLLADSPAVTWDSTTGAVGIAGGATLATSDTLVMPLTPHLLLAVGDSDGYVKLDASAVQRANILQLLAAAERVFTRPGADFAGLIDVQRQARRRAKEAARTSKASMPGAPS